MTINNSASVKSRRKVARQQRQEQKYVDKRLDVTSMTPEKVEVEVEKLYQKTDGVWSCLVCPFTNFKKYSLKRHVEVHVHGLSYTCNFCQEEFSLKNSLDGHISRVHRIPNPILI